MVKIKKKPGKDTEKYKILKQILSVIFKSTTVFVLTTLLTAFICYITDIEYDKYSLIMILSLSVCAFISGFLYSRKMKKNGILHGMLSSLPIAFEAAVVSLIASDSRVSVMLPIAMASIILSGAISGSFGVNSRR